MGSKVGSIIGLVGGLVAIAGFFMPWLTFGINLAPLRESLGALAGAAESLLGGALPQSISITGFDFLTGGITGLSALAGGGAAGVPAPDVGALTGPLTALIALIALVLVFAILTIVSSGLNLASGRLRGGMIGFGAATLALSVLLLFGFRFAISAIYEAIQQQAGSLGGGAGAIAGSLDIGSLLGQVFQLSVGTGIYLCIVGGVLGVVGGIMGRKREKKAPAPAPAEAPAAPPQA